MSDIQTSSALIPTARREGDSIVLCVRGEIDLHNSPEVRTELLGMLAKNQPKKFVLNLALVPYMDSSAVAVLVEARQKINKWGGKIYLTDLQPRVKGLLEIARLGTIFVLCKDEADALSK